MTDRCDKLDRAGMRQAFDHASSTYDGSAVLQAHVRSELLERLHSMNLQPKIVLDLGAATGHGSLALKRMYPRATVIALDIAPGMLREARRQSRPFRRIERLCGDACALPLADGCVDLLFSSLMLQWCDELDAVLAEMQRVLKPGGFLSLSTFGPDTLRELRAAWSAADSTSHVNLFLDMHDVGDALARAGFSEPVLDVDHIKLTYADVPSLARDLRSIGAHNVTSARSRGLTGRAKWSAMTAAYESFRRSGRLPATYEVVYGAAWGSQPRFAQPVSQGEVRVAPGAIRRHSRERGR